MQTSPPSLVTFYDDMIDVPSKTIAEVRRVLQESLPRGGSIFEIGCGTGMILHVLHADYRCAGIEASEVLLARARERLPGMEVDHGDPTCVHRGEPFDAVLCLRDVLNHIDTLSGWRSVFVHAADLLKEGGLFVCEFSSLERLALAAGGPPLTRDRDGYHLEFTTSSSGIGHCRFYIRMTNTRSSSDSSATFETDMDEYAFRESQVKRSLNLFFHILETHDLTEGIVPVAGRLLYVCQKRSTSRSDSRWGTGRIALRRLRAMFRK